MVARYNCEGELERVSGEWKTAVKDALSILMLSPVYFKLDLDSRKNLVDEYILLHGLYGSS